MSTPSSDRFVVETPENISFGYDVAGIGSRFLAAFVDTLIQGVVYAMLFFSAALVSASSALLNLPSQVAQWLAILFLIVLFLVQFGYFIFFEIITGGQSPGKRLIGLRVIKDNGYPLTALDSIIRNVIRIIDFFPAAYGIGILVMFLNDRAKRLGDFAAGTIVVKVREQVKLSELQPAAQPFAPATAELHGAENLQEADVELVESFFRRRGELRNVDTLAPMLAQRIWERMNTREPQEFTDAKSAEAFLHSVVAAYRRGRSGSE